MMSKIFKAVVSAVPGPVLAWVGEWIGFFEGTYIVRPNAPDSLTATATALATVLTVALTYFLFDVEPIILKRRAYFAGYTSVLCVALIFFFRLLLSGNMPYRTALIIYTAYDITTILFFNVVLVIILLAVLYRVNARVDVSA